ncbi:MAG: peptidase C39 family protein [Caldilineaceae bacterium]
MSLLPVLHQKQQRQSDCLVACAAMVLGYLHIPVRYEKLIRLLETEQHGSVFSKLENLRALYVNVQIQESSIDQIEEALASGLPTIVAVNTRELKSYWRIGVAHAVIVIGIDDRFVYANDPAFAIAPQKISRAEFELAWLEQDYLSCLIGL